MQTVLTDHHARTRRQARQRRGVTLIELLIALSITLVMLGAIVTLFGSVTNSVADSRAVIEISERLRAARNRLQLDMAGRTATTLPPLRPEADEGYFEIIEGTNTDRLGTVQATSVAAFSYSPGTNDIFGDADDVLMFTVRTRGEPFVGRMGVNGNGAPIMMESPTAEVIWFAVPNGRTVPTAGGLAQLYTLYRRVLLVMPQQTAQVANQTVPALYQNFDLAVRAEKIGNSFQTFANGLGDLTKRENRYLHGTPGGNIPTGFPFQLVRSNLDASIFTTATGRLGEDVILTDVLAFDVKVFDPTAPLRGDASGNVLVPSDPGWAGASNNSLGAGAFVDLGYGGASSTLSFFSGSPNPISFLQNGPATYCSWSLSYEQNGVDEDGQYGADQGTNGLDDDKNGIVDDPPSINTQTGVVFSQGERETLAPYPLPLRGVQVQIRVYEPDSRQVRQVTVVQDFLPE